MMLDRRTLLKRAGLGSAGLLLAGSADFASAARRAGLVLPASPGLPEAFAQNVDLPGMPPAITPTDRFYTVSKNTFSDPTVDVARWRLRVGGSVASGLDLDLDGIRAFPTVRQIQTLECIDNVVGGDLISNAEWTGVRLADVLNGAGLRDSVRRIVFQCEDDYSDSIPIEKAMEPTTLLAFEMNGQPLPRSHGFPVRLLAPNLYGIKNPKWITEIRAVDGDFRGFWQRRGWTNDGTIKTMSRIDVPTGGSGVGAGGVRVGGIAFAGGRGIQAVEISADQGRSWNAAALADAMTPMAWRLWTADWMPQAGTPSLTVRATDGTGAVQIADVRPALPDGTSGYHSVTVRAGLARAAGGTRSSLAEGGPLGGKPMPISRDLLALAEQIAGRLEARGESVAVAESSAGGLISAALLAVPGASAYFMGGGVVYTRAAKSTLLRLDEAMLIDPRPATEAHAMILARGIRGALGTSWGIGETGATGPTGNRYGDAAGHACIAVAGPTERATTLETGEADRQANMDAFAAAALRLFLDELST